MLPTLISIHATRFEALEKQYSSSLHVERSTKTVDRLSPVSYLFPKWCILKGFGIDCHEL